MPRSMDKYEERMIVALEGREGYALEAESFAPLEGFFDSYRRYADNLVFRSMNLEVCGNSLFLESDMLACPIQQFLLGGPEFGKGEELLVTDRGEGLPRLSQRPSIHQEIYVAEFPGHLGPRRAGGTRPVP